MDHILDYYPRNYVDITLLAVDGVKFSTDKVEIELLPGHHTATVHLVHYDVINIENDRTRGLLYESDLTVTFDADAERIYKIEGLFGPCNESGWTVKRFGSRFGSDVCLHASVVSTGN